MFCDCDSVKESWETTRYNKSKDSKVRSSKVEVVVERWFKIEWGWWWKKIAANKKEYVDKVVKANIFPSSRPK